MLSHSSMKIIDGTFDLARLNNALIVLSFKIIIRYFSVSPTYLLTRSAAETLIKVHYASVAQAFAK